MVLVEESLSIHCLMPSKFKYHVEPNATVRPRTVRGAYLFNLVDCIHACILRREHERARRAWAIFASRAMSEADL